MSSVPEKPRIRFWKMKAKGDVRYAKGRSDISLASLSCLRKPAASNITVEIPASMLGKSEKLAKTVRYNLQKSEWRDSRSVAGVYSPETPDIHTLLEMKLTDEAKRLNDEVSQPTRAHQRITEIVPEYISGLPLDPPIRPLSGSLRPWRRSHSKWLQSSTEPSASNNHDDRESFDRTFELVTQLDSPVDLKWQYERISGAMRSVVLSAPRALLHPMTAVRRSDLVLVPHKPDCLSAKDNCRAILASFALAVAGAARLYSADKLGTLIVTCQTVEAMKSLSDPNPVIQLQVNSSGWVSELATASTSPISDLLTTVHTGLRFFEPAEKGWFVNENAVQA